MYFAKKSEYNDIREKSFLQWLDEMEKHDDVAVRCGVKLAREYMQYLKDENEKLQEENELKNSYLKKMKMTNNELTNDFVLEITDFADIDEVGDSRELWESQVDTLRRTCGF